MPATSYVRLKDGITGATKAIFTAAGISSGPNGFTSLAWTLKRNGVHYCEFVLNYTNPDVALFADMDQIEIVRAYPELGIAEYTSFDGIYRDDVIDADANGILQFKVRAYGANSLLGRRHVLYPANKANVTKFIDIAAESFFKTLVLNNAGILATVANGRDREGNLLGVNLLVASDMGLGNIISASVGSRENLLTVLQKYAGSYSNGDFDTVRTGPNTYLFQFYEGQLGTNRSVGTNPVIFSVDRANMREPKLTRTRSTERTAIIVGGSGQETNRLIRTRTGTNYSSTNDVELFVNDTQLTTNAALDARGDQVAATYQYRDTLEYKVIQTEQTAVERDYFLGDRTRAIFADYVGVQIVDEITFVYTDTEEVAVKMVSV